MIILFYLKKFYVFDIVVCFGNWFCFYYLYDLLSVIVGVYFVYNDKLCGNFLFIMLIEYFFMGICVY